MTGPTAQDLAVFEAATGEFVRRRPVHPLGDRRAPVAMAGATRALVGTVRGAPVHSPPELRGRGCAKAAMRGR